MDKTNSNMSHLIIAFSEDLYKFYYALSLASSLKAINKNVKIFISGYACNFIKKNWEDYDKERVSEKLEEQRMGSIEEMLAYCQELEVEIFYCETALGFLNIGSDQISDKIKIKPISMYSVLNNNKQGEIIFI